MIESFRFPVDGAEIVENFRRFSSASFGLDNKFYVIIHNNLGKIIVPDWLNMYDYILTCYPENFRQKFPHLAKKVLGSWSGRTLFSGTQEYLKIEEVQ